MLLNTYSTKVKILIGICCDDVYLLILLHVNIYEEASPHKANVLFSISSVISVLKNKNPS